MELYAKAQGYSIRQMLVSLPVGKEKIHVCFFHSLISAGDWLFYFYFWGSSFRTLHGSSGNQYADLFTIIMSGTWV